MKREEIDIKIREAANKNLTRLEEFQDSMLSPKGEYHGLDSWEPLSARQKAYREGAVIHFRDGGEYTADLMYSEVERLNEILIVLSETIQYERRLRRVNFNKYSKACEDIVELKEQLAVARWGMNEALNSLRPELPSPGTVDAMNLIKHTLTVIALPRKEGEGEG